MRTHSTLQHGPCAPVNVNARPSDADRARAPLPCVHIHRLIEGLERTGRTEAHELALQIGRGWITSNLRAWRTTHFMFEKYSAVEQGRGGGGGEYTPQVGFGWSNGVALSLLARYGDALADGGGDMAHATGAKGTRQLAP